MKNNDQAVSPVIGVTLMIVVTIIIAAVVSAFATSTDIGKQTGPVATLDAKTVYNTEAGFVGASWTATTHHDSVPVPSGYEGVDCYVTIDDGGPCDQWFMAHESICTGEGDPDCYIQPIAEYDEKTTPQVGFKGNTGSNTNGLLFTNEGGDPIDLKDLELSVRYFNLASTVHGTDTKFHCGVDYSAARPSYADVLAAVAAAGSSAQNLQMTSEADYNNALANSVGSPDCRYFVKVGETSTDDTIIRPGDQFMFRFDTDALASGTGGTASYGVWAVAPVAADGYKRMSIAINTESGETEWWLNHRPSGKTLVHGMLEFPKT